MSDLENMIRTALRDDEATSVAPDAGVGTQLVERFLRHSRWVAGFARMKMGGTLLISIVSAIVFFAADSERTQLACAALFVVGFAGFGMWWTWYWMMLTRGATLREIKRLELQISALNASEE